MGSFVRAGKIRAIVYFTNQFHFAGVVVGFARVILRQRVALLNFRASPGHFGRGFFVSTSGEPL
jgi:hypothetical protein